MDGSNGIDAFKLGFGGIKIEYYNLEMPISLPGRVALTIKSHIVG